MLTHARRRLSIGRAAVTAVATLALVAGCSGQGSSDDVGSSPTPPASTTQAPSSEGPSSYVALGDSFTAGPGIAPSQADAGFCQRSTRNWPTLAASALNLDLVDLSCSGATTSDLSATAGSGAVPEDAGLVTVSAGGNDGGLFLSLIRACTGGTRQCRDYVTDQTPSILRQTTDELSALLADVRTRAPRARVLLVGYPRIAPASGTCDALGIPADDVTSVLDAETALEAALRRAAERAEVDYVSLRGPSDGHDACAGAQAWTNGTAPRAGDGIVFHPNAAGMAGVAEIVASAAR